MAAVALFGLGTHLNRVGLVEREFREGGVSFDELEDADDLVGGAAVSYGLGLIATARVRPTPPSRARSCRPGRGGGGRCGP
jgi:hypothetical protein